MVKINLNNGWQIRSEELWYGPEKSAVIAQKDDGWMVHDLPCDIHMPLLETGLIEEPVEADNSYAAEWTENKSWWFKKEFNVDSSLLANDKVELTLEYLDVEADIFLNGTHLGHHKSIHYPFTSDVKELLKLNQNTLLVRVTSGLEYVSDQDMARIKNNINTEEGEGRGDRGDRRRAFVRKPQYVFGWDWGPRVATCGVTGNVYIKAYKNIAVRSVHAYTIKAEKNAEVAFEVEIENIDQISTKEAAIKLEVEFEGISVLTCEKDEFLRSGTNYVNFTGVINDAKLWWPNGMGRQDLYTVKVSAHSEEAFTEYRPFRFGIRTTQLKMDRYNNNERLFYMEINSVRVFCKGANWIPADSIYARVTTKKYDTLLKEAVEANFNMLRVWGGGIFEPDFFYEKCDEYGIMLWHDFMFGCALYPDYLDWFKREAVNEINYQTKRLRSHPSIVLWCGNNENHTAYETWWKGEKAPTIFGGAICYNNLAPEIVKNNCPEIPYWNSSPYGGVHANDSEAGDIHHWGEGIMHPDMEVRISPSEYDKVTAKFVSEYGYVGPCRKSSIVKYHAGNPLDIKGRIWQLHNNTFEKDTVLAGIAKHYEDPEKLDMDSYLLYAGLCQGMMLGYSLESFRYKDYCSGGLFWMYNDCWGEVGWTIVDYYLKRKISYYYVMRALAHMKLIMREENGLIKVVGINDTGLAASLRLEYGYTSFDGKVRDTSLMDVFMPAFSRTTVLKFNKAAFDDQSGCYYVKPVDYSESILTSTLKTTDFRKLILPLPNIKVSGFRITGGNRAEFAVSSDVFAHAVHFNLDDSIRLSDEYFDLLPGEIRKVTIYDVPDNFSEEMIKLSCVYR